MALMTPSPRGIYFGRPNMPNLSTNEGMLKEFALMYNVCKLFPLHYIVFKQVSVHLPHELNSEQTFSRFSLSGNLSDPKMKPLYCISPAGAHRCQQGGLQAKLGGHHGALILQVQQVWHKLPEEDEEGRTQALRPHCHQRSLPMSSRRSLRGNPQAGSPQS